MRRLLVRLAEAGCRALAPDWGEAARAELEQIAGTREPARWALGLARLALPPARAWAVGVAAAAAVAWLDLHVESAATSLVVLLALAAAVGALTRRPWLGGVLVGLGIVAAHLTLAAAGHSPPSGHPATVAGSLALLVLLVPALAAAHVASRLRPR